MGKLVTGVVQTIRGNKRLKEAKKAEKKAKKELDKQKAIYQNIDTSNPFEGMVNQFAGLTNQYAGLENTMEDLTINKQQSEFEAQQFAQNQSNILSGLREASGGSGIAALAQSLAQQGQIAAQKSSAAIGMQESANQRAAAAEAGRLQTQEAKGGSDIALQKAQGQASVDAKIAGGAQTAQQLEMKKQSTLLDMESSEFNAAQQQTTGSQAQKDQGVDNIVGGGIDFLTSAISDRKLKKNIKLIGKSPSGIKIYLFEYKDKLFGEGVYQGVMSDELSSDAVINGNNYDMVDYSKIDVEFKKIK
tara:strand:+ start:1506 stop:2414 length:909 start_codon:yes stop_codon:yes gene_type:complete